MSKMADHNFCANDSVIVLYTFKAEKKEDLACKKRERLTVLKLISDPNWLMCKNSKGDQGLVPVNHVVLVKAEPLNQPWYYGSIRRKEAEKLLLQGKPGDFLVRASDRFPGDYAVCVKSIEKDRVDFYHVIIKPDKTNNSTNSNNKILYSLDEETWFNSVDELIQHYQNDSDGLCCKLNEVSFNYFSGDLDSKTYNIRAEDLTFGQKIGCGEFNEVLQGKYKGTDVAIKCFKKSDSNSVFNYEARLMAKLNHPNLVKFIGVSQKNEFVYIITELMENGSLVNYLRSRGRSIIQPQDQINFAIDACKGMMYLEENHMVHRDLAARNILLSKDLEAKVSDFGLANYEGENNNFNDELHANNELVSNKTKTFHVIDLRNRKKDGVKSLPQTTISDNNTSKNGLPPEAIHKKNRTPSHPFEQTSSSQLSPPPGTTRSTANSESTDQTSSPISRIPVKWTAPEALANNVFTNKSDVWSFGILLWEIYSFGRTPYPRIYANDVRSHLNRGYRMDAPEDTPKEMYELMRHCWSGEPEKRPNFKEILAILEKNKITILATANNKPKNADSDS